MSLLAIASRRRSRRRHPAHRVRSCHVGLTASGRPARGAARAVRRGRACAGDARRGRDVAAALRPRGATVPRQDRQPTQPNAGQGGTDALQEKLNLAGRPMGPQRVGIPRAAAALHAAVHRDRPCARALRRADHAAVRGRSARRPDPRLPRTPDGGGAPYQEASEGDPARAAERARPADHLRRSRASASTRRSPGSSTSTTTSSRES